LHDFDGFRGFQQEYTQILFFSKTANDWTTGPRVPLPLAVAGDVVVVAAAVDARS
jgi:hypothetical protein